MMSSIFKRVPVYFNWKSSLNRDTFLKLSLIYKIISTGEASTDSCLYDRVLLRHVRPSSDAELFMSRTLFKFVPTKINKSTPVDLDFELNSPNLIQFEPKLLVN